MASFIPQNHKMLFVILLTIGVLVLGCRKSGSKKGSSGPLLPDDGPSVVIPPEPTKPEPTPPPWRPPTPEPPEEPPEVPDAKTSKVGNQLIIEREGIRLSVNLEWGSIIDSFSRDGKELISAKNPSHGVQITLFDGNEEYDNCSGCTEIYGWNPAQGGDKHKHGSPTVYHSIENNRLFTRTKAIQWNPDNKGGGSNKAVESSVEIEQTIRFHPKAPEVIEVKYRVMYSGSKQRRVADQDLPVFFINPIYDRFVTYSEDLPWTSAPLETETDIVLFSSSDRFSPEVKATTERWASYTDESGFGITVYYPFALPQVETWRSSELGANYIAPMVHHPVTKGVAMAGSYFLIAGKVNDARNLISKFRLNYEGGVNHSPRITLTEPLIPSNNSTQTPLDVEGELILNGWAIDENKIKQVTVFLDDTEVGTAEYGARRAGLDQSFPAYRDIPNVGFDFTLQNMHVTAGHHTVSVAAKDSYGKMTKTTPFHVNILSQDFILGNVERIIQDDQDHYLEGWTCARKHSESLSIHVYFGGPEGQGQLAGQYGANYESEKAIAQTCESDGTHYRFRVELDDDFKQRFGGQKIYVYGVFSQDKTYQLLEGSGKLEVPEKTAPVVEMAGKVEGIQQDGLHHYLKGWACLKGRVDPIKIQVFAGSDADHGHWVNDYLANNPSEPEIATACASSGTHYRFKVLLDDAIKTKYPDQPLYVYAYYATEQKRRLLQGSGRYNVPEETVVPVYRFYIPTLNDHVLTLSPSEGTGSGYQQEGIAFYVLKEQRSGTVPLYRCYWRSGYAGTHFVSTNANCFARFGQHGSNEGTMGYVYSNKPPTSEAKTGKLYTCFNTKRFGNNSYFDELNTINRSECTGNNYLFYANFPEDLGVFVIIQ